MPGSRRFWEILAVVLTGLGRFVFMIWLDLKAPFIITVILGWSVYIYLRVNRKPGLWKKWGFSKQNLAPALRTCLGFALLSILVMGLIGYYQNSISLSWHMVPLLLLYPIWGFFQQFLVQALVTGNLEEEGWSKWVIIPFVGLVFGLVHLPFPILSLATFIIGMFFAWVYLKWRNLWPLGLFHGWLGVILYFWVLGRDPWAEVFGSM